MIGDTRVRRSGSAMALSIGADVPMSARWAIRAEIGGRWPGVHRSYVDTLYYEPNPAAPDDPSRAILVRSDTSVEEDSLADAALLVRFGTPHDRTFQLGALAGPHVEWVRTETRTLFPRYGVDPANFTETRVETHHVRTVFDVGLDAGVRLDERWTLVAYGLVGLQPQENRRAQPRGGVLAKWSF
ncbi:MAG TPA: hypothetical protein VFZ36_04665 [Vicinamibacterales bacterium]